MIEPTIYKYCNDLQGATNKAKRSGVGNLNVLNGLVGTIALSIKGNGGNDKDVADAFRVMADCYDEKSTAQHCPALRGSTVGRDE